MVKLEAASSLCSRKSFALNASSQFTIKHKLAPPLPAFAVGDVCGKAWSTLISTQQGAIHPQTSLGFAIQRVTRRVLPRQYIGTSRYTRTSRAPIYWRFAFKVLTTAAGKVS